MLWSWISRNCFAVFAACALVVCAIGYVLGARAARGVCRAERAELVLRHESAARLAAQAAIERLQAAHARGDALAARVAEEEARRQTEAKEHQREINRLTTGRACLNADTVRLLNGAGAARPGTAPMPASAIAATQTAAPAASDTDVAGWADRARRQYDTCRAQLDALIAWHTEEDDGRRN